MENEWKTTAISLTWYRHFFILKMGFTFFRFDLFFNYLKKVSTETQVLKLGNRLHNKAAFNLNENK